MRVLVVDEEVPFPLNSGKRIRTFNLLKHLASGHEITFVSRRHEGLEEADKQGLKNASIKAIVVPHEVRKKSGSIFYLALFANLFSRYPYSVSSHYSRQFVSTLQELISASHFDIIHCEWTPYTVNLKPFSGIPTVVAAHNVEAQIWQRSFQVEGNLIKKAYIYFQWKKMAAFEKKAFSKYCKVVAVSDADKSIIAQREPENRIAVVENGVDVDYFIPSGISSKPHSLVFTGAMDWRPNVDAMLYFLDEIWPNIKSLFPGSTLTIVGRHPVKALRDKTSIDPDVKLTGTVDDVRPYIEESSVYIVPLRIGGGSRLKILEAFSMCKPVVSTSVGAEGLDVVDGRDLIIANDPKSFVSAVGRLFSDDAVGVCLGQAGRSLVEGKYQWKALARKLEKVWLEALRAGASGK